ncbi:MAG: B12-binding domain-containing radical SAM protein [Nitrospirota bacterium]|nr:B12-binding domain-containing radical SAM protein [Nitrospirota bacterium]
MKIILTISPREGESVLNYNPQYVLDDFIKYPPLGLLSIVRNIGPEHEVILYDAHDTPYQTLLENILREKPDLLGISAVTERFYGVVRLAADVKQFLPETGIIVGGTHTDLYPSETMTHPVFDFMLTGPAEQTFPRFVEWYASGRTGDISAVDNLHYRGPDGSVRSTRTNPLKNMDDFPFPDRKRLDIRKYVSLSDRHVMTTMTASRGCSFRCTFCNVPRYYATKSADRIVDEIEEILSLGFDEIHILDYTFNISKSRVNEICSKILQRGLKFRWSTRARLKPFDDEMAAAMKEAGCFRLTAGVESHDPRILQYINKGTTVDDILRGFEILHRHKLESLAYFIIGFPNQTPEEAWTTRDFIKLIKPDFILMNTLLPVPFSDFYFELVKSGVYDRDHWQEFVLHPVKDFRLPSWRGDALDRAFTDIRDGLMREFYLAPSFVAKEAWSDITHLRFGQLGRKIGMGVKMLLGGRS